MLKSHQAYRLLFGNLTPAEAQNFFKLVIFVKKKESGQVASFIACEK